MGSLLYRGWLLASRTNGVLHVHLRASMWFARLIAREMRLDFACELLVAVGGCQFQRGLGILEGRAEIAGLSMGGSQSIESGRVLAPGKL